jgi:hypothetical protein
MQSWQSDIVLLNELPYLMFVNYYYLVHIIGLFFLFFKEKSTMFHISY